MIKILSVALYIFASAAIPVAFVLSMVRLQVRFPEKIGRADGLSLSDMIKAGDSNSDVLLLVAIASVLEELLFRGLGSCVFGTSWVAGICIALVFAAAHGIPKGKWLPVRLPVPQLLFGLWFWRGLRMHGLLLPITAHVATNVTLFGLMFAIQKRADRLRSESEHRTKTT